MDVKCVFMLCLLFCFCKTSQSADGLTAEIVFDLLSRRFDTFVRDIDNVKSDFAEMKKDFNGLKYKIESLEAKPTTCTTEDIDKTNERDTRVNFKRYSNALNRMFTTEKKIIRNHFENIEKRFGELQTNINLKLSLANLSMEKTTESLFQDLSDHKSETNDILLEFRNESASRLEDIADTLHEHEMETMNDIQEVRTKAEIELKAMEHNVNIKLKSEEARVTGKFEEATREQDRQQNEINGLKTRISSQESNTAGLSRRIGVEEERRQTEINGLKTRISSQELYTTGLSRRIAVEEEQKVAFTVILDTKQSSYGKDQRIIFDYVIYSHGGGFDTSTGIFTAPKSGTYLFTFNIASTFEGLANAFLMVSGYWKVTAVAEKGANYNGGNACVAYLYEGDTAWVETGNARDRYYIQPYRTTFNGVLID